MNRTTGRTREKPLSPEQAAEWLGLDRRVVYNAIRSGQLRASRVGRGSRAPLRIDRSDLEGFLKPVRTKR